VISAGPPATSLIGKPVEGMRVGIAREHFYDELDDGVGELVEDFLSWLADRGTGSTALPDFGTTEAVEHCVRIIRCEGAAFHQDRLTTSPEDFSPDVRARLASGFDVAGTDLVRSQEFRQRYRRRLAAVFDDVDVVVTPTVTVETPVPAGEESFETTRALGRATLPWSLHDGPSLSLPVGCHPRSGTPVGVSLTARRFGEATLCQVAAAYQEATDWHTRRPDLHSA
jgi:aspartyl-tRNA(Asn)/glutamyl-tRNA(Gln) amidotransferase subunit A